MAVASAHHGWRVRQLYLDNRTVFVDPLTPPTKGVATRWIPFVKFLAAPFSNTFYPEDLKYVGGDGGPSGISQSGFEDVSDFDGGILLCQVILHRRVAHRSTIFDVRRSGDNEKRPAIYKP